MPLVVATNDAVSLTDADLDEMGSMEGAFDIGAALQGQGGLGPRHHRPHRGQAARLHVLHARADRRHAVRADRHAERAPPLQARHGAAGPDARGVPPGADGVPRRGRRHRLTVRHGRRARSVREARRGDPAPGNRAVGEERAWGRRLAKRFGVDAKYDAQSFVAKQRPVAASSTSSRPSPRSSTPKSSSCSSRSAPRPAT